MERDCARIRAAGGRTRRGIEPCGAGHDHRIGARAVKLDGFLLLRVVPDQHPIGVHPHQPLVREVVPAERKERDRYPQPVRRLDVIGLVRLERDEGRDQDEIGLFRAKERLETGIDRTFHGLRGFNEVYRAARAGIDLNFMVKALGTGIPITDIGGPPYHLNHLGSMRISKALHRDHADSPWGDLGWHSSRVTYNNRDEWGLAEAPARRRADGTLCLDFDWRAVPPLVELRRVVLPARVGLIP